MFHSTFCQSVVLTEDSYRFCSNFVFYLFLFSKKINNTIAKIFNLSTIISQNLKVVCETPGQSSGQIAYPYFSSSQLLSFPSEDVDGLSIQRTYFDRAYSFNHRVIIAPYKYIQ